MPDTGTATGTRTDTGTQPSPLAGKRVVITGSSRGLGRAIAVALAQAGASVVINGTNPEALAETASLAR